MKKLTVAFLMFSLFFGTSFSQEVECWAPKFEYNNRTKEFTLYKFVKVRAKHHNWWIREFDVFFAYRKGDYLQIEYAIEYLRTHDRNYVHVNDMQMLDIDFCKMTEIESRKYRKP